MVTLTPLNADVPPDVAALVEAAHDGIADGSVHPFSGPIHDQAGNLVVPEGEVASDGMLLGMNLYVEGIDGSLPQ